jgi:hypothetical protein
MTASFDMAELSHELAELGARAHLRRIAVVVPLDPLHADMARAAIAEGPPFDPRALGLRRHEVLLREDEAIFVFDLADEPAALERVLDSEDFWSVIHWWEKIARDRPRFAEVAYVWDATDDEGT